MGPRRTSHKQREPGNYEALGKIGRYVIVRSRSHYVCSQSLIGYRRTGTMLKDTGVRDEHGFEPIPSFSSPAKSLLQPNGIAHDATNSAEDSMEIDQSENYFYTEAQS